MKLKTTCLIVGILGAAASCALFEGKDEGGGPRTTAPDGTTAAPPPVGPDSTPEPPRPPTVAIYKRGSLPPIYKLLPRTEYGRLRIAGVTFQDADYATNGLTTSARAKLEEIATQIAGESGGEPPAIFNDATDRDRAGTIPFRGNPSDVRTVDVGGVTKAYVPLGGDVMTPGNEVAVVANGAVTARLKVGVRPQRIAMHPAGLAFVCNQYSNYISIIDVASDTLLAKDNVPVEIKTEFECSDLVFANPDPRTPDPDRQFLYVANRWRHSVSKYKADVVRDPVSGRIIDIVQSGDPKPTPSSKPLVEIFGVGNNPWRLALAENQSSVFVANQKGGELARIELATDTVTKRLALGAPSVDVLNIRDLVYVATTTRDRGLLARTDTVPPQAQAAPSVVNGLDGQPHTAHPGAMFDDSKAYNFEDLRNGLFQLDALMTDARPLYYTDDVSAESNYQAGQKVLAGALPVALARSASGDRIFAAMEGSDLVQELGVDMSSRPYTIKPTGRTFPTEHRPFALTTDGKSLFVADAGSEKLEVFDLATGTRTTSVDLGYASPAYPATNIERGERAFYDASWSNNGRKSCATCHIDELDTDGIGYSNGAQAPTLYHQVKPNHDLLTTDGYFWNGSFMNGNYASVAFAAQTRVNCELVELGMIEGPASDPNSRIGDPKNRFRIPEQDVNCRPQPNGPASLANEAAINQVIAAEKKISDDIVKTATGFTREELSRKIDFYSVSELRLPPNPLTFLNAGGQLASTETDKITRGRTLFQQAGCSNCHHLDDARHPYTDGKNHGPGADWPARFIAEYRDDPRLRALLPDGIPQTMIDSAVEATPDKTVNLHRNLDYFMPFCFTVDNCLEFQDPLAAKGNQVEETRRLELLIKVNLANPDRGTVVGNVVGQARVNTPSLRGVWTQAALLHHGLARTIPEAILAPGHPALGPGENGFAVGPDGFDVHGATSRLSKEDVAALVRFVETIE